MASVVWWLISVLLCCSVTCYDECVTFDFEDGFDTLFSTELGQCANLQNYWIEDNYASLGLKPPDERSTTFIAPQVPDTSCVASFVFNMTNGSYVDVLVFTENAQPTDQIVAVAQTVEGATIGNIFHMPVLPDFVAGWTTLRMNIVLPVGSFESFIVLMGMASATSTVLVDSFRYVPPDYNEHDCIVYGPTTLAPPTTPPAPTTALPTTIPATALPTTTSTDNGDDGTTLPVTSISVTTPATTDPTGGGNDGTTAPVTLPTTTDPIGGGDDGTTVPVTPPATTDPTGGGDDGTTVAVTPPATTDPTGGGDDGTTVAVTPPATTDPTGGGDDGTTVVVTPPGTSDPTGDGDDGSTVSVSPPGTTDLTGDGDDGTTVSVTLPATTDQTQDGNDETKLPETGSTDSQTGTQPPTITPKPITPDKKPSFWNAFTIAMVTFVSLIVLIIVCLVFYELGKRKARMKTPPIIIQEIDYNALPKPLTVPRVTKAYPDGIQITF